MLTSNQIKALQYVQRNQGLVNHHEWEQLRHDVYPQNAYMLLKHLEWDEGLVKERLGGYGFELTDKGLKYVRGRVWCGECGELTEDCQCDE